MRVRLPEPETATGERRAEDYLPIAVERALVWASEYYQVNIMVHRSLDTGSTEVELFFREYGRLVIRVPSLTRDDTHIHFEDGGRIILHPERSKNDANTLQKLVEGWIVFHNVREDAEHRKTQAKPGCTLVVSSADGWAVRKYDLKLK